MEAAVTNLEQVVKKADNRLGTIAWKLDEFQKGTVQCNDEMDERIAVVELLQGVHQIREDYQMLHEEIRKVQSLQKELNNSLRDQAAQVKGNYIALCKKLRQTNL